MEKVRQGMRNQFRLPGLRVGIGLVQGNGKLNNFSKNQLWTSLLLQEVNVGSNLADSFYEEILKEGETIIIEDISRHPNSNSPGLEFILGSGFKNLFLTPLKFNGHTIGILELASPLPGEINGLSLFKVNRIKPIFENALKRFLEEFDNKVEAKMLEQFTSIHPSIQWRFRDAAISLLEKRGSDACADDICFENVYPFYGSLDIRDSSKKRNEAIEQDLVYTLEKAAAVLKNSLESISFDILGELINDIEEKLNSIKTGFSTGDEMKLKEFIQREVNPVITHLNQHYSLGQEAELFYKEVVCADSGISTTNRLLYEGSLAQVNQCIADCLTEEEAALQKLFPCYFEKYQTDGVEYNIYLGASITPGIQFNPLYLDNLRLRQLVWTCKIMKKVAELFGTSANSINALSNDSQSAANFGQSSIQIAPLILAHGNPITLKFRPDEKRLDVHGAYNIRYEILKKRVDKATVLGTHDRLTQPGQIAIVYSLEQEAAAYLRHVHYLANKGYVEDKWEDLRLDPLQSVEGLRAARIKLKDYL